MHTETVPPIQGARRTTQRLLIGAAAVILCAVSVVGSISGTLRFGAWLGAIVAGAWSCRMTDGPLMLKSEALAVRRAGRFRSGLRLAVVVVVALVVRTAFLDELPQGAYVDEVFTLRNTLTLLERPFAPFGHTPLINPGWVETPNLYLYFNALIVKLFGVSYFSVKLFSVVPGVLACAFFYAACTRLFPPRVALLAAVLIVFSHWHVRLSRYGWDASFLVMTLAAAVWLLLRSFQRRAALAAYLSGVAAGAGLYSYIGGRLCMLSFLACLVLLAAFARKRDDVKRLLAFVAGALITSAPLLAYYLAHPATASVRVGQVSVFEYPQPLTLALGNAWWHALMFHVRGGVYARDNYPGLPMLDVVTGILLVVGLRAVIGRARDRDRDRTGLLLCLLLAGALAGGVFSVSQEGAPYPFRVSAAIVPTLLLAAIGLQRVLAWVDHVAVRAPRRFRRTPGTVGVFVACAIAAVNLYSYFVLERRNISAARVMGSEYRLIGQALRRTRLPAVLIVPDVLAKPPAVALPGERHFDVNQNVRYDVFGGADVARLAIIAFSGRYDTRHTVAANLANDTIRLSTADQLLAADVEPPVVYLFPATDRPLISAVTDRHRNDDVKTQDVYDTFGQKHYTLLTIRSRIPI